MKTPPAPPLPPGKRDLTHQLRDAILASGLSQYDLARKAGVNPGQISRFLRGESGLQLDSAARLALALGLSLVEVGRAVRRGRPPRNPVQADPVVDRSLEREDRTGDDVTTPEPAT